MAMNTPYLSENTTHFTSNLTIDGTFAVGGATTLSGALQSASAASFGAVTATTVSGTSATYSGRVSIGGGTPIVLVSASSTSLAATTAAATKSTETTFTNNAVALGDIVTWGMGNSTSSLSQALAMDLFVSAASTITIRLSNVSTVAQSQPAISITYKAERLVF